MGEGSGTFVASGRLPAALGALLLLAALAAAPPGAAASGPVAGAARAAPPTAAQVERRTRDFSTGHGEAKPRRGGGGVGVEPTAPDGEALLGAGNLAVALYGAPQLTATAVGKRSPAGAARKLRRQARAYASGTDRPLALSIDLIGVIATSSPGSDRKYRTRQSDAVIRAYLKAARSIGARLMLDIQPGRSTVLRELRALRTWIALPDVDVAIDPEWNVGPKGVPGSDEGSISYRDLNRASRWIDALVEDEGLPAKAMVVHQFRRGSIKRRRRIKQRDGADVLLNFDGIGSPRAKKSGYASLAVRGLFDGFSLFYDRDAKLMRPRAVLRLRPRVDFAMYQ